MSLAVIFIVIYWLDHLNTTVPIQFYDNMLFITLK